MKCKTSRIHILLKSRETGQVASGQSDWRTIWLEQTGAKGTKMFVSVLSMRMLFVGSSVNQTLV